MLMLGAYGLFSSFSFEKINIWVTSYYLLFFLHLLDV
jgi:fluoride ion exporter CrcB/FEX